MAKAPKRGRNTDTPRRKMEQERRSLPEAAPQANRDDTVVPRRAGLLRQVLDEELPLYAWALERLGQ